MLAVFLVTLNHGVAAGNLRQVVELSGWNWRPNVFAPVTFLVTYPLRWLPASVIALAANLFSALCAALTLALLARCVTLLPERSRFSLLAIRSAWLPPVLAVFACGLQITFWENAIEARGEMLDLLLFAYLVRCLLEFRLDRKQSWLTRFALIYGLSLANNWAMVGFLPFFLVALLWTKPLSLLNLRFLKRVERSGWETAAPALAVDLGLFLRMALFGLTGLSLFLLPPLIASLSHTGHLAFWPGLSLVLGSYKYMLLRFPKSVVLLLSLTSVLPILFMGVSRWVSFLRKPNPSRVLLVTKGASHLIHGSFLIAGIWVALDCPVSPRHQGLGFAFLPFYYLGALSIGYFSGYFLLIFGPGMSLRRRRRPIAKLIGSVGTACIWFLLVVVPCLLLYRNVPQIRASRHNPWHGYFALVEKSLPAQGTVILCDDPFRTSYFQAALAHEGKQPRHLLLDTTALGDPAYLQFLDKKYPQFKLASAVSNRFSECAKLLVRIQLLESLSRSHDLYYLHPSLGYYSEAFYPEARGLIYQMRPYGTNVSKAPLPTREQIGENQFFWQAATADQLPSILGALRQTEPPANPNPIQRLLAFAHLNSEPDRRAQFVGAWYSRALDHWGVELQECGAYLDASKCFSQARELNPDNVAARVNQEFNQDLQAGKKPVIQPAKAIEDKSGHRREWDQVLQEDGPFAEPNFCYQIGVAFAKNGLYRQAIQQFNRVQILAPDLTDARFWLTRLFIHTANYSNALAAVDQILQTRPSDDNALFLKAVSLLQSKAYDEAIPPFTYLLNLHTNNYAAQLNRAVAYLQLGKLDAAQRDYQEVAKALPRTYQAWFGLAEIAYRRKDTPAAITNYQCYLTNAPPDTEEAKLVIARLKDLKLEQR
jgi:tetratricopeptide (TPR) repeat protein